MYNNLLAKKIEINLIFPCAFIFKFLFALFFFSFEALLVCN